MKFFSFFGCVLLVCLLESGLCDHCELDQVISQPGEKYPIPEDCGEYTCHENGFLSAQSCPYFVSGPPFCELIPEDLTKPYPECCEKYKC